jgi:hypothetical protein
MFFHFYGIKMPTMASFKLTTEYLNTELGRDGPLSSWKHGGSSTPLAKIPELLLNAIRASIKVSEEKLRTMSGLALLVSITKN